MRAGDQSQGINLDGLQGQNPLAYLAALGTLRALAAALGRDGVRMGWSEGLQWMPWVVGPGLRDASDVLDALETFAANQPGHAALRIGDNIKFSVSDWRHNVLAPVRDRFDPADRPQLDFFAAFAADVGGDDEAVPDTALRTMSGAGHQHFLATMRALVVQTKRHHLDKALFHPWAYDDPVKKSTLRWDPVDDVRYALRWRDPSGDPARTKQGTMWGANRLAFEALPLMPTMPRQQGAATTGFRGRGSRDTYWTWPIWRDGVTADTVPTLLALRELQDDPPHRDSLEARGIPDVYRAQRITVDKFRSFTPAWAP